MAFDNATRARLQRFVTDVRSVLTEDFSRQLQQTYGMDPASGELSDLGSLKHLDDQRLETAQLLREIFDHYLATETAKGKAAAKSVLDRILREQAFTILNRLAALRMMEARGILIESIGKATQSQAFQLYQRVANGALGETGEAYSHFLNSLFDLYAADLPALFDRFSPESRLFPREATLIKVLELINDHEIARLWPEDETIGWIYQYFNSQEERKAMRQASQAPRNSRELAVRNQFFTPRYVVEFLVDNTLGRLWFNWTGGQTALRDRCQYLLVKPDEQPKPSEHLRDPRTIKLLDPACGSMHFGLYAFDLFQEIYREAWEWEQSNGPDALDRKTGGSPDLKPLSETYADREGFLRDVPRLIIERNIYGVDIDPRAAQIASLAIWLRAQRAWHEADVKAKDRPQVGQGHVVAAVAPPAELELRKQFMEGLDPLDADLFEQTLFMLKGLPELGVLLQVEKELPALIRKVFGEHGGMFTKQDAAQWQKAEARLRDALTDYARAAQSSYQGRLFAEDALQGLRMIDYCNELYDVIIMNPPFGEWAHSQREYAKSTYASGSHDIITAFIERNLSLLRRGGFCGEITSRTCFFAPTTKIWRERVVLQNQIVNWVDLGPGILDGAMVETCLSVLQREPPYLDAIFFAAENDQVETCCLYYRTSPRPVNIFEFHQKAFSKLAGSPFSYWTTGDANEESAQLQALSEYGVEVRVGIQTGDDFRFIRCWWEVAGTAENWLFHAKGGENEPFFSDIHLVLNWKKNGAEMKAQSSVRLNMFSKFDPSPELPAGLTYAYRTNRFSPGFMPRGVIPGVAGMGIYSNELGVEALCSILNSSIVNDIIDARLANKSSGALYQAGVVKSTQLPRFSQSEQILLREFAENIWRALSLKVCVNTSSPLFRTPFFDRRGLRGTIDTLNSAWSARLKDVVSTFSEINKIVAAKYGQIGEQREARLDAQSKIFESILRGVIADSSNIIYLLVDYSIASSSMQRRFCVHEFGEANDLRVDEYLNGHSLYYSLRAGRISTGGVFLSDDIEDWTHNIISKFFDSPDQVIQEIESSFRGGLSRYIRMDSGFFKQHLARYSRSRRKAPIYWPLSTVSGDYTLWLYYPDLTDQTLFTAVNNFLEPKLQNLESELSALHRKGQERTSAEEREFEKLQTLQEELTDLRDTLLQLAPTYKPNHDDGVQITAAPLWRLFRHKPWQKVLKDTWEKLEAGDYDWAHLALSYWPERVREKCKTDKSLAIAHDLEHLYEEDNATSTAGRRG